MQFHHLMTSTFLALMGLCWLAADELVLLLLLTCSHWHRFSIRFILFKTHCHTLNGPKCDFQIQRNLPRHCLPNLLSLWALTELFQNPVFLFPLEKFLGGFTGMFLLIVMLHGPPLLQLQVLDRWAHIFLKQPLKWWRIHVGFSDGELTGPCLRPKPLHLQLQASLLL